MKKDGTKYYVGLADEPRDVTGRKCKSIRTAEALAEHYQIFEMCEDGKCNAYAVRTATKRNVKIVW